MIRLFIAFICAAAACMLVGGALSTAQSPASPTVDTFVTQVTNSAAGGDSFGGDTSANGRFLVIESTGDISTEKVPTFRSDGTPNVNARNNEDGNREIFVYDYAQRRIFQLTNTKSVLNPPGSPSPTPSPSPSPSPSVSPSPTPFPSPTPVGVQNVAIEISNNRPMISLEGTIPIAGQRTYTIVFSSNADNPASFDGTSSPALAADANQEIWTYKFTVPDVANLSSGAEVGPIDLAAGVFKRITNTPASAPPVAGSTTNFPRTADDNRDASITDDGRLVAFVSTANLNGGTTNSDRNPEVFTVDVTAATLAYSQVTTTATTSQNNSIFSANPCLSSDGSVLAFVSNANLTANNDDGGGLSNAEVYVRDGSGLRQVTKTKNDATTGVTANIFSFGRRLSRDGKLIAFESTATDPKANATPAASPPAFSVPFVYNIQADTFTQVGPRALAAPGDVAHFPTFTDYDVALSPHSVVFSSALNFKSDGTFPTADLTSTGLNPLNASQVFIAPLPASSNGPFTRLTNNVSSVIIFAGIRALPSNSYRRMAFSLAFTELGGGNADNSSEVFYQLAPNATESTATLTMSTGASRMTVPVASPTASPGASPSPSPTATATPSPGFAVGLAPGELAFVRGFANPSTPPASVTVSNSNASESKRAPALPIELNGVSVAIRNAACGLYAVSPTEIKFVAPIGLGPGDYGIVINNNGVVSRGTITIVASQPDIFTSTNGPLGRAAVCNITNPAVCSPEPFGVTTNDGTGTQVATVLRVSLTGTRYNLPSSITVTVGTTAIIATAARSLDLPGSNEADFVLPSTVNTGDLPIVITVAGVSSRPTDTAPHITINPGASPNPNPITTSDFFVRQQYLDFLNREPDSSGFAFWTNQINSCGSDQQCIGLKRVNVSGAFFLSIEFQQTGYLVERMYKAAYGTFNGTSTLGGAHNIQAPIVRFSEFLPDTIQIGTGVIVGQSGWESALETNKQNFANAFVARTRFTDAFPSSMSATSFVDALYVKAGLAPASGTNRAAAISEFNSTTPSDPAARARALRLVAEDPMLVQQEFNNAFVLMQYFGYLRRDPNTGNDTDYTGYDFWLTKLNQFNGNFVNAEMVKAFIDSSEYKQRFGQ